MMSEHDELRTELSELIRLGRNTPMSRDAGEILDRVQNILSRFPDPPAADALLESIASQLEEIQTRMAGKDRAILADLLATVRTRISTVPATDEGSLGSVRVSPGRIDTTDHAVLEEEMREKVASFTETAEKDDIETEMRYWGHNHEWHLDFASKLLSLLRPSPASEQLREAAQKACDYYFHDHGEFEYLAGTHDDDMKALRSALTRPPQEEKGWTCNRCGQTGIENYKHHVCPDRVTPPNEPPQEEKKALKNRIHEVFSIGPNEMFEPPKEPPAGKRYICKGCGKAVQKSDLSDDKTRHAVQVATREEGNIDVDFCGPVVEEKAP